MLYFVAGRFIPAQWAALLAVTFATYATSQIVDRGWRIGFFVNPFREFPLGVAFAVLLIGSCDLVLMLIAHTRHTRNDGFPWLELATIYIPAAFHEELAFRGYLFQKLRAWNRIAGFAFSSLLFAMLHLFNNAITVLAVVNIALAGILLALAYERYERLWFPIGIHLTWNILSGPILGYPVSGFVSQTTVLSTTAARGPGWITGGAFGIEGSVVITIAEIIGIVSLQFVRHQTEPE